MSKEWLSELKPGDQVILDRRLSPPTVRAVDRVTKTQIVLDSGEKFRKDSGRIVGSDLWNISSIREPTEEGVQEAMSATIIFRLRRVNWEKVPDETRRAVYEVLKRSQEGASQ